MKHTVVTRLMKAIEIAYKEHLPQWEFPNKEIWIQEEKEQIINANRDGVDMVVDKKDFISGEQYYNKTFNTNEK